MNQLDWNGFFERDDRQHRKRHELIEQISADRRVKQLLHALTGFPTAKFLGDVETVSVPMPQIAWKLERSENTTRSYIDLAARTSFLEVLPSGNQSHTYSIHWGQILGESLQDADSTADMGSEQRDADSTACPRRKSSTRGSTWGATEPQVEPQIEPLQKLRGSKVEPQVEPLNFENMPENEGFGELRGSTSEPLAHGLKTKPVFKELVLKKPVLKPVSEGVQLLNPSRRQEGPKPKDFWGRWTIAIATRDLINPEDVEQLYLAAVELGAIVASEQNRFRVFCQAALQVRMWRAGTARTQTGLFKSNVANGRWFCTQDDEEAAREMIKRLGHRRALVAGSAEEKVAAWTRELQARQAARESIPRAAESLVPDSPVDA